MHCLNQAGELILSHKIAHRLHAGLVDDENLAQLLRMAEAENETESYRIPYSTKQGIVSYFCNSLGRSFVQLCNSDTERYGERGDNKRRGSQYFLKDLRRRIASKPDALLETLREYRVDTAGNILADGDEDEDEDEDEDSQVSIPSQPPIPQPRTQSPSRQPSNTPSRHQPNTRSTPSNTPSRRQPNTQSTPSNTPSRHQPNTQSTPSNTPSRRQPDMFSQRRESEQPASAPDVRIEQLSLNNTDNPPGTKLFAYEDFRVQKGDQDILLTAVQLDFLLYCCSDLDKTLLGLDDDLDAVDVDYPIQEESYRDTDAVKARLELKYNSLMEELEEKQSETLSEMALLKLNATMASLKLKSSLFLSRYIPALDILNNKVESQGFKYKRIKYKLPTEIGKVNTRFFNGGGRVKDSKKLIKEATVEMHNDWPCYKISCLMVKEGSERVVKEHKEEEEEQGGVKSATAGLAGMSPFGKK